MMKMMVGPHPSHYHQCSETAQPNGTRGSVVFCSNQGGTLYRWYHCTNGTNNGTGMV
jgi:hypothetical protein